jgi:hypothetical protein
MVAQTVEGLRTRLAALVAGLHARLRRSSWGERALVGGSAAALFALLFLPWLTTSCDADCNGFGLAARTIDGVHGWGLLTLLGLLAVVGLWAVRCYPDRVTMPALPLRDPQVYMLAGALELVGVVLFWFEFHASVASFVSVGVRPTVGWFLAFAGATATLLGGWLLQSERLTSG